MQREIGDYGQKKNYEFCIYGYQKKKILYKAMNSIPGILKLRDRNSESP